MIWALFLATLVATVYAGPNPNELSKEYQNLLLKAVQARAMRPVQAKPNPLLTKRSASVPVYKKKIDEIARAYAEGYKAALLAVQARSSIQKPIATSRLSAKAQLTQRSAIPRLQQDITVNAIEKSGIPRPGANLQRSAIPRGAVTAKSHTMVQRSASLPAPLVNQHFTIAPNQPGALAQRDNVKRSDVYHPATESSSVTPGNDKRVSIERLNYAARHRNVYLDSIAGDSTTGASAVLTRQHFWLKKHRRDVQEEKPRKANEMNYAAPLQTAQEAGQAQPYMDRKSSIPHPDPQYVDPRMQYALSDQEYMLEQRSSIPSTYEGVEDQNEQLLQRYQELKRKEEEERIKREHISRLNYAARHRNVYLDRVGGDPYGGASSTLTRQHIWFKKHKRSTDDEENDEVDSQDAKEVEKEKEPVRSEKGIK